MCDKLRNANWRGLVQADDCVGVDDSLYVSFRGVNHRCRIRGSVADGQRGGRDCADKYQNPYVAPRSSDHRDDVHRRCRVIQGVFSHHLARLRTHARRSSKNACPNRSEIWTATQASPSCHEVEVQEHVSRNAVAVAVGTESHTSGVVEADRPISFEDPDESAAGSRTLEMACVAAKGHRQDTTMLPLGAIVRSRGLIPVIAVPCGADLKLMCRSARGSPAGMPVAIVTAPGHAGGGRPAVYLADGLRQVDSSGRRPLLLDSVCGRPVPWRSVLSRLADCRPRVAPRRGALVLGHRH